MTRKVNDELTRVLYRSAGFGLFSNFMLAAILAIGVGQYFAWTTTRGWFAAISLISCARLGLNLAFKRRNPASEDLLAFLVGVTIAGLAWGAARWLFFGADNVFAQLLLMIIIAGMNTGAALGGSGHGLLLAPHHHHPHAARGALSRSLGRRRMDARPHHRHLRAFTAQHGQLAPHRPSPALPPDL